MDSKPKVGGKRVLRGVVNVVVLLAMFAVGVNVGNGRISWPRSTSHAPSSGLPANLDYSQVEKVYDALKANYDGKLTQAQLQEGLKHGLATATKDPYTTYFNSQEAKDFSSELNNSFSGIGAQLGQDSEGNLEVIAPIDGLPADKAGLKAKDIISNVNGTNTFGLSVDEAVHKIRGPKGTKVTLQIVRNKTTPLSLVITREEIKLPSVKSKTLDGDIGYLQISTFAEDTTVLVTKAAKQFKQDKVKGVVLDLRDNPGGLLPAAVDVSSLWLKTGSKVLDQKTGSKVIDTSLASGESILEGVPTVVLINAGSASASEIVAGALHDNKAAYLIGEKSYGKGVVQQLVNFRDGSQLKVTVASWYRPNGQNINHRGITPDKTVKPPKTDPNAPVTAPVPQTTDPAAANTNPDDTQLQAAQSYLNSKQ